MIPTPTSRPRFNPTLVRLRPNLEPTGADELSRFQSHAGSIEARPGEGFGPGQVCFNPTLVRLRQGPGQANGQDQEKFQSHAGSIEALRMGIIDDQTYAFQSHAGSIEASSIPLQSKRSHQVSIPRWFD